MHALRLPLLVKLAIIFLAVMVVPAAIVAIYVKQQFNDINIENQFRSLDYGRTSLSALLDEEWQSLFTLSQSMEDTGVSLMDWQASGAERMFRDNRGVAVYSLDGRVLYDRSLSWFSPTQLIEELVQPESQILGAMLRDKSGVQRLAFSNDRIILLYAFIDSHSAKAPSIVVIQSSLGSYVFDALRRVAGLRTSIFAVQREDIRRLAQQADGTVQQFPVEFSTAINEYAERIRSIGISTETARQLWEHRSSEGTEDLFAQRLFIDSDFVANIEKGSGQLMAAYLPLLSTGQELYMAEVTIPREDMSSPEEIEYLWVIISALFILVLLMSLLITMYVVAPIMNLNQGVENLRNSIGSDRGFEELVVQSNDEIGDLANSFNHLAKDLTISLDKIRLQRREILEYAQNLEDKVKQRTQEAESARVRAEMANIQKSKFLVNMNHEFRTPLNSISGITDLLSYGAYDKNDEMAVLLEDLTLTLGNHAPQQLHQLTQFLYDESNAMRLVHKRLSEILAVQPLDEALAAHSRDAMSRFLQLIEEEERGRQKAYQNISEAGKTLIHIVDDVINLSRIESGSIDIRPELCSLSEIVNYAMVHSESYCRAKGKTALIQLEKRIADNLPERIFIDHYRIKQILLNYLSNAIKYTDSGLVELSVESEGSIQQPMLKFSVSDQGIGIAPSEQHLIFREFGRTFKVRDIEGTGLGLAISRKMVEAQNGSVGFESEPGKGSVFWFIVPLMLPNEAD